MAKKSPPPARQSHRLPAPPGIPAGLTTVLPDPLPPGYEGRTAFVPEPHDTGVDRRHAPQLRFTLGQARVVAPAVQSVIGCRKALDDVPNLRVPPSDPHDSGEPPITLPPELADAFARLVVEMDRVIYLAGRSD